jgi:hypothetical protein
MVLLLAPQADCRIQREASLPITIDAGRPQVQASINGHCAASGYPMRCAPSLSKHSRGWSIR